MLKEPNDFKLYKKFAEKERKAAELNFLAAIRLTTEDCKHSALHC